MIFVRRLYLCRFSVGIYFYSVGDLPGLCVMSDFQSNPGHFCIMFQEPGSYLNVLFYFDSTGEGGGASLYCQEEVEVQVPCLVLIDTWGQGGRWLLVVAERGWEVQLRRWFLPAARLG